MVAGTGSETWLPKIIYAVIGAAGALLPYAFREGAFGVRPEMTEHEKKAAKFRAGLSVLGGFLASLTLTDIAVVWAHQYLPGTTSQIEHGVALFVGLSFMQVIEMVSVWWAHSAGKILDRLFGVDRK